MTRTGTARTRMRIAAGVAIIFGILTIFAGGRALFGGPEARAAVGNAVPFVLWFNTFAGFAYVAAGLGLLARRRWAAWLAAAIALATLGVFAAFRTPCRGGWRLRSPHRRRNDPASGGVAGHCVLGVQSLGVADEPRGGPGQERDQRTGGDRGLAGRALRGADADQEPPHVIDPNWRRARRAQGRRAFAAHHRRRRGDRTS